MKEYLLVTFNTRALTTWSCDFTPLRSTEILSPFSIVIEAGCCKYFISATHGWGSRSGENIPCFVQNEHEVLAYTPSFWFRCTYIDTKLFVIYLVPKISTICKEVSTILVGLSEALVDHVPNEAALKSRISLVPEGFPIEMQVAIGIVHGMAVLAKYNRSIVFILMTQPFQWSNTWIHRTNNVRQLGLPCSFDQHPAFEFNMWDVMQLALYHSRVVLTSFIAYRTAAIEFLNGSSSIPQVRTTARFVPKAPHNDARVVVVPPNHTSDTAGECILPSRIVCQSTHWLHSICLYIGFVTHIPRTKECVLIRSVFHR